MTQKVFMMGVMTYFHGVKVNQLDDAGATARLSRTVSLNYEKVPRSGKMEAVLHMGECKDDTYVISQASELYEIAKICEACKAAHKDPIVRLTEYATHHLKKI